MDQNDTSEFYNVVTTLDKDAITSYLQNNKYNNIELKNGFKMLLFDTDSKNEFEKKMDCLGVIFSYISTTLTIYNKLSECSFIAMHFAFIHALYSPAQFFFKQKHFTKVVYKVFECPKWRRTILKTNQAKAKQHCMFLLVNAIEQIEFIGKEDYSDWEYFKGFLKIAKDIKVKFPLKQIVKKTIIDENVLKELLEIE